MVQIDADPAILESLAHWGNSDECTELRSRGAISSAESIFSPTARIIRGSEWVLGGDASFDEHEPDGN